ncbi:MAG TPA: hypothetical protein DEB62_03575 [Vibrio sp.]|uniref:Tetratricopeptide repeat protein n=3 Tax=Vibrionaceae TaxID=641 RepID=A0A368LQL1_9VIBR|nr:hypothetical protein CIK83_08555 [Vibrio casei]HBV75478.1 hypothetical protein [Vibrio sp.]
MRPFQLHKRTILILSLVNKRGMWLCLLCGFIISLFSASFSVGAANLSPYAGKKLSQASQLAQNDKLDKAIEVLKEFKPSRDYDKAFVSRVLGIYYWQAEQPKSSLAELRKSVLLKALDPKAQWQTNRMLGDILYSQQDFVSASKAYQQTLNIDYKPAPADKAQYNKDINDLYFRIAAANYQQQKWTQVRRWLVKFNAPDANKKLQALRMQVIAELRLKQWSYAEGTLTQLIRIEPNNKGWWQQQISAQLQQNKAQSALDTYALAKKQNVEFTATDYKALSQLYAQNRIPERAARILQEMFVAYPDTKTQANQKTQALYYQAAREWPQAIDAWASLAQRNAKYYWPLTQLYIQQKQYDKAVVVIEKAKPYVEKTEFSLAKVRLLYRLEKYNDALAEAKRLNEVLPSESAQTWIAYLQNKLEKAGMAS